MSGVRYHRRDQSTWKGVLAGMIGGLAGAWTMNQFQAALSTMPTQLSSEPSPGGVL